MAWCNLIGLNHRAQAAVNVGTYLFFVGVFLGPCLALPRTC